MEAQTLDEERLLTLREIAGRLQISESYARKLYRENKIPGIRIGYRILRFKLRDVLDALEITL